jgi:hypothetical protein
MPSPLHFTFRTFTFIGFHPSRDEMRSSPVSMRSYSFVIFGFCLLFLIFGYRSLISGASQEEEEDYFAEGEGEGDAGTESGFCWRISLKYRTRSFPF